MKLVVNAAVLRKELIAEAISLDTLPPSIPARVFEVRASDPAVPLTVLRRLAEIGFIPGEHVLVTNRVAGGTPLAVRIGTSTFALRSHEARCVQVIPLTDATT